MVGFPRQLCSHASDPVALQPPCDLGLRFRSTLGDVVDGARDAGSNSMEKFPLEMLGLVCAAASAASALDSASAA